MKQKDYKTGYLAKRLLKLADFLDTVPKKLFDLETFANIDLDSDGCEVALDKMKKFEPKCGATACAMGWCPTIFPKLIKWYRLDVNSWDGNIEYGVVLKEQEKGKEFRNFKAAEKLFGLNTDEAEYLFQPSRYPSYGKNATPKSVAKRIRKFVKDGVLCDGN